jgi:hypothetical protein
MCEGGFTVCSRDSDSEPCLLTSLQPGRLDSNKIQEAEQTFATSTSDDSNDTKDVIAEVEMRLS